MNRSLCYKSLVAALAGIALLSAGCRQREAEDVPPLNKEAPVPAAVASAEAETSRNSQSADERAKADKLAKDKVEADAKAAEVAGAAAKTDADAKAAAEIVATRKAAEEADARALAEAKAEADALAKSNAEAVAREKAAAEAIANGHPAPAAPVVAVAPIPAAPLTPAEKLPESRVLADSAPGLAKELATGLASFAINENFGAEHGRLVVQINRTVNRTDSAVNRSAVTKSIGGAFADVKNIVTSDTLNSGALVQPRAMFLAFETEAKALRLVPSSNLRNAPDVIVNSVVAKSDAGATELKLSATDTRTGKVFWTESKPL